MLLIATVLPAVGTMNVKSNGENEATTLAPILNYSPKSHDFGYVQEGKTYQITFDIWNDGTGTLDWHLGIVHTWVFPYPFSGSSTGEHDTVTVTIDTTGLSPDSYEGFVSIYSNGGDGMFDINFIVSPAVLAYSPTFHDFGNIHEGNTYQTTFDIWNDGTGTLDWHLGIVHPWISPNPFSGSSTGEHDTVTVTIDTTGLSLGDHMGFVSIYSNGGEANFEIKLTIKKVRTKDIHKLENDWSYQVSNTILGNRAINTPFLNFLQQHLNLFPILQKLLLQRLGLR